MPYIDSDDNLSVIFGQGTIGLEILDEVSRIFFIEFKRLCLEFSNLFQYIKKGRPSFCDKFTRLSICANTSNRRGRKKNLEKCRSKNLHSCNTTKSDFFTRWETGHNT